MDNINILSFDDVSGIGDKEVIRRRRAVKPPMASPCNGCVCESACAGARREGGTPDWSKAMACSVYAKFAGNRKRKKLDADLNKMPSRVLFARLFG